MSRENYTIVDKKYLEKLENFYTRNVFEGVWWLEIQDIKNIDVVLPSMVKYLKLVHESLIQERIDEKSHDRSMEIVWAMNIVYQMAQGIDQQKINWLRATINKYKKDLQ